MPASPQKRRLAASFRGWLAVVSLCEVDDPDAGGARFAGLCVGLDRVLHARAFRRKHLASTSAAVEEQILPLGVLADETVAPFRVREDHGASRHVPRSSALQRRRDHRKLIARIDSEKLFRARRHRE
jgi:hypothetical protein